MSKNKRAAHPSGWQTNPRWVGAGGVTSGGGDFFKRLLPQTHTWAALEAARRVDGLSVVRWITEAHGGAARLLESERGAAFEVSLPA